MNKYNETWENEVLKNIPEGISSIKQELSPLLDEKLRSESVIADSNNQINTPVMTENVGISQGQSNENVKVRTIGARTDMPIHTKPSVPESNDSSANYGQPGLSNGTYEEIYNNRMSGFTDLLILVGTGFLVLLVFVVSYLMLNYFG